MTSPKLLVCLAGFFMQRSALMTNLSSSVQQGRRFISANAGSNLTLECILNTDVARKCFWYKQALGQKPRKMSNLDRSKKTFSFYDEWKTDPRFSVDRENGHLIISDLHISDSAFYICACSASITFEFTEGTLVSVHGSGLNVPAFVYPSASETIQPGASMTLNCTTHTGTCAGEHSVSWFKNTDESSPGLFYTHGGRNDQCEGEPNTEGQICVYNLAMKSLDLSNAGTYYCAVVSCGHVLFGNGTRLDLEEDSPVLVYLLSGALTIITVLSFALACKLLVNNKKMNCECGELSDPSTVNAEGNFTEDNLHYSALKVNKAGEPRRQRDGMESECVYSRVKQ